MVTQNRLKLVLRVPNPIESAFAELASSAIPDQSYPTMLAKSILMAGECQARKACLTLFLQRAPEIPVPLRRSVIHNIIGVNGICREYFPKIACFSREAPIRDNPIIRKSYPDFPNRLTRNFRFPVERTPCAWRGLLRICRKTGAGTAIVSAVFPGLRTVSRKNRQSRTSRETRQLVRRK